ncbi:undecaprenyl pyrophosphate synthetase [Fluviicoccus keumensis]|uniref:Ditrans,polycis-undecaprenyl-diphosphate synthase ((2E,6E)-farnesyl-diphosphate specific) n=1 Tax=Fluviicoccus keumensis TaxID=1435465 RepID=A0A4V2G5G9_9GAMM|nr:polyprenyl diphosphate synthase [Fluviicoccus keumensis]RZU44836.1 undecaprenyl pyrophosphate synthetase [Fluviicoccus keumensis]
MSAAPDIDSTAGGALPRHVAIIMDGNNRWAKKRLLPGGAGHKAGESALHRIVEHAARRDVEVLTVFAFSSENWRRPENEVTLLMKLFLHALEKQVADLHAHNIRIRFIGDLSQFAPVLQDAMRAGMLKTAANTGMTLVIAVSYGGQWDMANAARELALQVQAGTLRAEDIDTDRMQQHVQMADLPPVDLLIRTGGELRISNFVLWQAAYAEFYFSEKLWPDFDPASLDAAFAEYAGRQRRFGRTSAQVENRHA